MVAILVPVGADLFDRFSLAVPQIVFAKNYEAGVVVACIPAIVFRHSKVVQGRRKSPVFTL